MNPERVRAGYLAHDASKTNYQKKLTNLFKNIYLH